MKFHSSYLPKLILLAFITLLSQNVMADSFSKYVGQSFILPIPKAPQGAVTSWAYEESDNTVVTNRGTSSPSEAVIIKYFTGSEIIQCNFSYAFIGVDGRQHTANSYEIHRITCIDNKISISAPRNSMKIGESMKISYKFEHSYYDATPTVKWETSNSNAFVDYNGNVTAKKSGKVTIYAKSNLGSNSASCEIDIEDDGESSDPEPTITAEVVDLGLSVKWTTCNLGASDPTGFGNKYSWGATEPDTDDSPVDMWTTIEELEANGVIEDDHFTPEYDACTQELGEGYRVPTKSEWQELMDNCRWESVKVSGKYCIKGTSKKNWKSIIFPRTTTMQSGTNIESKAFESWSCTTYSHPVYSWAYYVWENNLRVSNPYIGSMEEPFYFLHDSTSRCRPLRAVYDPSSGGIDYIETEDLPVEYYNLQGLRLQNPQIGQLVIRKKSSSVKKTIYTGE